MRKILFVMIFLPMIAMADDSGSCGTNVTYTYVDATHTLTISGNGEMNIYSNAPWSTYKSDIVKVVVEDGITSVGGFIDCSSLMSVSIPNSVTAINNNAFYGCVSLPSITIPSSVTSIGGSAFGGCSGLMSVHISDIAAWCNIKFFYGWAMTCLYSNPLYYAKHLYLNNTEIKDLIIPNNVTSIQDFAFLNCSGLTSVTIPGNVTSIGNASFYGCSGLSSVIIGSGVTLFGEKVFEGCSNFSSATIENGVTSIGKEAFSDCLLLDFISIPNSVTSIGESAFRYCRGLKTITLPDEISMIKNSTFKGCRSLKSVIIPSKVEFIYQEAFVNCGLEEVKVLAITPPLGYDNSFSNYDIPLYCPEASISSYQSTNPWNKFSSFKTLSGEDVEMKQCNKPLITFADGKLIFTCDTEGAECVATITDADIKTHYGNEIPLTMTYTVSVYATKEGYKNSDVVTKIIDLTGTAGSGVYGDVNGDGVVNAADVVKVTNIIMGNN